MKAIKPFYEDEIEVYCSAFGCEDKLMISVCKDYKKFARLRLPLPQEETFYFRIVSSEPSTFWGKLERCWRYLKGWRATELSFDDILLNTYQAEEMAKCILEKVKEIEEAYNYTTPGLGDMTEILKGYEDQWVALMPTGKAEGLQIKYYVATSDDLLSGLAKKTQELGLKDPIFMRVPDPGTSYVLTSTKKE